MSLVVEVYVAYDLAQGMPSASLHLGSTIVSGFAAVKLTLSQSCVHARSLAPTAAQYDFMWLQHCEVMPVVSAFSPVQAEAPACLQKLDAVISSGNDFGKLPVMWASEAA